MSVVVDLKPVRSASKEAYFEWEITLPSGIDFKKGMLCLTDIDQDGDAGSAIYKYQLHSTESPYGSHIFEDLHTGPYYARLTIIGSDDSITSSALLTVTVYYLGAAEIDEVSPRDSGFNVSLKPYDLTLLEGDQEIATVNFILFGRKISLGALLPGAANSHNLNVVRAYRSDNEYKLDPNEISNLGITNGWQYEIACFYTDNKIISGDISNTVVSEPTNKPNKIRDVKAVYDYTNKQLIVKYTNPDDISEWKPTNVRATITYGSIEKQYVFPISASSNSGTDFQGQQVVFNESSLSTPSPSSKLPVDISFNITLRMESEAYGYSDFDSEPVITSIVPLRFCSEPTTISNVEYIVGDNEFSVTYTKANLEKYDVTVKMVITNTVSNVVVYNEEEDYVSGTAVYDVENGGYYKVNLQVFYTAKFDSNIKFGPCTADITYFDKTFIPHGIADAPRNPRVTYGDGSATLSWDEPADFHGYFLDKYQFSIDNGDSWTDNGTNRTFSALCSNGYDSGREYNFIVRAITKTPNASIYTGTERIHGNQNNILFYPLKKPEAPYIDSQTPGDTISDITFHDGYIFGGVKQYYNYTISNAPSGQIPKDNTSYTFEGLTNYVQSIIRISLVTKSGPDNVQEGAEAVVYTTPYKRPVVPTLSAEPNTSSVKLTWTNNNPTTINSYPVQYEVEYKLVNGSTWDTSNSSVSSSPLTISGLTPNAEYNFRIRSKVYNLENDETIYSTDYSTTITSRPFIYTNAPTMNIVAGKETITVELTRPVSPNQNHYDPHAYHATVALNSSPSAILEQIDLTTSSVSATLTFTVSSAGLVDLKLYKVVAWYDMVINEPYETTSKPYESDEVSNQVTPFDPTVAPLLFSDPADGQITLSWNDDNMDELDVTGYEVSSKLYSGQTWGAWQTLTLAECNQESSENQNVYNYYIVKDHANGTKMSYRIRAVILNADNEYKSAISREAVGTPYTYANAPTLVSYVSSNEQINLTWAEPSILGGLPLYRYEVSNDSGANWTHIDSTVTTTSFSGLTNGDKYTFAVRAVTNNRDNVSQASNIDSVDDIISTNILNQDATPYAVPTISIDAVVSGDRQLDLSWTQYLGGHVFDHYKIHYNSSFDDNITSTNLNYPIMGLTNGTPYACAVEVYLKDENDNAAQAVFSKKSSNVTNTPYVPAVAPKIVRSVPSDESVELFWDSLTESELGWLPLKRYQVQKTGDSEWITANGNLSHNFTGLDNGELYTFKVRALTTNSNFGSDPSLDDDEVIGNESADDNIPYLTLAGPDILACEPLDKSALLTWSAPDLVGLDLHHYEVSGGVLTSPFDVGTSTQYTFTGLTNNTRYSFNVKAVTTHTYAGSKTGPESTISKIPFVEPDPVTNLVCSAVNKFLTITFTNPTTSSVNNGLSQDYRYKLIRLTETESDIEHTTIANRGTVDITSYGDETIGVYVYSRIHNPNDSDNNTNSVYSNPTIVNVVNSNLTSDIQNLTAIPGDQQITLNWENLGSGNTYYIARINDDGSSTAAQQIVITEGNKPTATISPLVNGTLYRFNVYASKDDMLQVTARPIGPPLSLSASNTTVNVNFNGDNSINIIIIGITGETAEVAEPQEFTTTDDKLTTINQLTVSVDVSIYITYVVIASNSVGSLTYVYTPP